MQIWGDLPRRRKKRTIFGEGKSDDGQTERQTNSISSCTLDPFENESCTWSAHKKSSNESCLCIHQCWFFEVTWGEFLPFLSYWHWTYPPTAIRDYSRSPLIFVCENFGQEVTSVFLAWMLTRHSVEYAKDWLAFHRLSWSSLVKYLLVWKGMLLLCPVLPAPSGVVCLQKGVWYGFDQMEAVINHFRVHEAILAWWQTNKRQPGDLIASLLLLSGKAAF